MARTRIYQNERSAPAGDIPEEVSEDIATGVPISWRKKYSTYRDIIREFAVADFRLRYHDSVLGYFWFLLSPMLMFGVYYFVFTQIIYVGIPDYAFYLLLGILSYNFFHDCTFSAMYSLTAKAPIIKKIYFPRYLIIFSSTMTAIFSLLVNLGLVVVLIVVIHGVSPLIYLVPIPLICLILFSTGVGFLLATLYVYFRDLTQIWNVLVLALFWITPVVYNIESIPEATKMIVYINPLARIFMLFRHFLLYNFFDFRFIAITVISSVLMFIIGFYIFRRHQDRIAEYL